MSITRHHNDWLRLVPNSGPFLSLPVLALTFPQGLNAHDAEHARRLRQAFGEWDDDQLGERPDPVVHRAWVRFVLGETLGFEELLAEGQEVPQSLKSEEAQYGETLRPDWIATDPASKKVRLLVQFYPRSQPLTKPVATSRWKTSPDTRMTQLLTDTGIRLGLVTNGHDWMLVNAPKNETTGYANWRADLWLEEPVTLRAFRTLLSADRFFSVSNAETLDLKGGLLDQSQKDQQEVTDQLGYQVRKAVEVVIQALDKADQDHGRKLLADVDEKALYESALTVMMRLVFLFCAEERELLLLGDDLYDKNYAVSTLREQLRLTADEYGEEILGLRYDAWTRLLTTFRAVYAGSKHDRLKLPAYGGSLFNPDRFPFLEGRRAGTSWKTTPATPLPVSNRTVLHLLEALQVLQTKVGKTVEARSLSFRSLDIEQIGHVYEGLLDHTAVRATEPMLGLAGTRDQEPEIALAELEKIAAKGEKELLKFLKDATGRSESALKKALTPEMDDELLRRFRTACQDSALWNRVKPYTGLVRVDTVGYPVVITTGSVFVTAGSDRRSTGTHYTPKSLTEPIVRYTLEPLVFDGASDGIPEGEWKLKSARDILVLKVCDIACGSGAFLVETCRYLATRLQEAWQELERQQPGQVRLTPEGLPSEGAVTEELIPADPDEREAYARRIVAQRCVYGVDKNPLAVEIAKLSLWLLTLAKDKPFEFLDHAIRHGDSLVGLHDLDQLRNLTLSGKREDSNIFLSRLDDAVNEAIALRNKLESRHATSIEAIQEQERYFHEASALTDRLKRVADVLIGKAFGVNETVLITAAMSFQRGDDSDLAAVARSANKGRTPFHWPLEFPEVMIERGGFDAIVGNPPFMGGQKITGTFGDPYREYLVRHLANGVRGSADICAYFFIRGTWLLRKNGQLGSLATNTIAQGDTREVGLEQLLDGSCVIPRAVRSHPWPGAASLEIALVWVRKGKWASLFVLDHKPTTGITAYLTAPGTITGKPYRLKANERKVFQGPIILGMGFTMSPAEAKSFIAIDSANEDVLYPYIGGEDLTSRFDVTPSRWVINFGDMPLNGDEISHDSHRCAAAHYADLLKVVETKVRPQREKDKRKLYRDKWWQFAEKRRELTKAVESLSHVFVRPRVSSTHAVVRIPAEWVVSNTLYVFAVENWSFASLMQSSIHEEWVKSQSSTLKEDTTYHPTDCFETFPFPSSLTGVEGIGEKYHARRHQLMQDNKEGLTRAYHRFHNPNESNWGVREFRELHVEMDQAVAAAYGWADLDLDHGFHETKQGVRYTISEAARREVLARLLTLNHERYAAEVKQGLHDTKAKRPSTSKPKATAAKPSAAAEPTLFDDGDATFPGTERDNYLCGLVCDLVAADPGLPVSAYVDSLVIALGHERHKRLLTGRDATKFGKLCKATPLAGWSATDKLPWAELSNLLQQRNAIVPGDEAIQAGAEWVTVRESYPAIAPELLALLRKAAAELRELQAQVGLDDTGMPVAIPAEKAEILRAFVNDRDQWYGVAA